MLCAGQLAAVGHCVAKGMFCAAAFVLNTLQRKGENVTDYDTVIPHIVNVCIHDVIFLRKRR